VLLASGTRRTRCWETTVREGYFVGFYTAGREKNERMGREGKKEGEATKKVAGRNGVVDWALISGSLIEIANSGQ
jgi:hypothetical protein